MRKSTTFSPELRERAIRLVGEQRAEHESQWAAIVSIAGKMGCTLQTVLSWVRQHETDTGQRSCVTTTEQDRVKALEREVRELRKANLQSLADCPVRLPTPCSPTASPCSGSSPRAARRRADAADRTGLAGQSEGLRCS